MKIRFLPGVRQALILLLMAAVILIFSRWVSRDPVYSPAEKTASGGYAGSDACARCHKDIAADHRLTAHFRTSADANDSTILGSFRPGQNEFRYPGSLKMRMERTDSGLFQVLYSGDQEQTAVRFDVVVGSGTKGQTYLYWGDSNRMFQMPVSYFTPAHTWSNSPGYPGIPVFGRKINGRCLECHASFAVQTNAEAAGAQAEFDPDKLVLGIGCERCHGPASEHVAWQTEHPKDTAAHAILRIKDFSRKQKLDLCRFCHGGNMPKTRPSFTYLPGEDLDNFFAAGSSTGATPGIDVHGNQYGLLAASLCFRAGEMTCNNCHNSHRVERDNLALFAGRCQTCHRDGNNNVCGLTGKIDASTLINCVDCHMPRQSSKAITMYLPGENHETAARMRTHQIAVYPDATDQVLAEAAQGKPVRLRRVLDVKSGRTHYRTISKE